MAQGVWRTGSPRLRSGDLFQAPTARHSSTQGNALGNVCNSALRPEGRLSSAVASLSLGVRHPGRLPQYRTHRCRTPCGASRRTQPVPVASHGIQSAKLQQDITGLQPVHAVHHGIQSAELQGGITGLQPARLLHALGPTPLHRSVESRAVGPPCVPMTGAGDRIVLRTDSISEQKPTRQRAMGLSAPRPLPRSLRRYVRSEVPMSIRSPRVGAHR